MKKLFFLLIFFFSSNLYSQYTITEEFIFQAPWFEAGGIVSSPNTSLDDDPEFDTILANYWAKYFRISGVLSGSRDRLQITREEEYTLTLFWGSTDTLSDIEFTLHQGNGNSEIRLYEISMQNNMFCIKLRDCYHQTRLVRYDNGFALEDVLILRCAPHVYYEHNVCQEIEKRYVFRQGYF